MSATAASSRSVHGHLARPSTIVVVVVRSGYSTAHGLSAVGAGSPTLLASLREEGIRIMARRKKRGFKAGSKKEERGLRRGSRGVGRKVSRKGKRGSKRRSKR